MAVDVTEDSNLILLLGLDPSLKWTVAEVQQHRDQKRNEWNGLKSGAGPRTENAKRRLDILKKPEIEAVLASQSALDKHVREAREIRERQRKQAEAALLDELQFARAKGYVLTAEKENLRTRYAARVSADCLERHLGGIVDVPQPPNGTIPDQTLKRIDDLLVALNKSSLYTFVGVADTASNEELMRAADKKAEDARNHPPSQLQYVHQKDLAGDARDIFSDGSKRIQYDRHIREVQFMQSVLNPYLSLCALTGKITLKQAEYLLERARKAKWTDSQALHMLSSLAASKGWQVQVPESEHTTPEELAKALDDLRQESKRREDAERRERQLIVERNDFKRKLGDAKQHAGQKQQEIDALERQRHKAEQLQRTLEAEKNQDRKRAQEVAAENRRLALELEEARARQREKEQERIAELGPRLATHIARHELVAARAIIQSFLQVPPQWQADAQQLEADISKATRLLEQSKAVASVDPLRAEQLLDSALALCADLEDAVQLRRRLPPVAPSKLDMAPDEQGVVFSWLASPSSNVRYVVIRKEGSKPASIHDGIRIAETSATRWRDDAPPPARTLWYAVYAEREGTASTVGSHARKALFLLPEVADLRRDVEDGCVTLSWRSPARVSAIIIVRREGTAPRGMDDGKRYELGSTERFQDNDVHSGARYFYRVYCEYLDAAYTPHHSEGILIHAMPESPPQEVPALEVRGSQGIFSHTVSLIVEAPLRGELRIYRSDGAPDVPASGRVPVHALQSMFGPTGRSLREMSDTLIRAMHVFYTPVIIFHDTAYLGEPHEYVYAPRLTNVRAETAAQTIRVQWKWAIDCEGAEVSCTPLGAQTMNPHVEYVACIEGNTTNPHLELRGMPRGDYDIAVRAQYRLGNHTVFSDLEHVSVHVNGLVVIRYAVHAQNRIFDGKQYQIALSASEPLLSPPPPVIVVRGTERAPTSPDDGERVPVPAAERRDDSTWVISLNGIALHSNTWLAVFPASAQQQDIRYEPESLESQRIP